MNMKFSVQNNKDIVLTFNKASLTHLINAMGLISKEAKKSSELSWRQYKKGDFKVLKDANDLIS